MREREKLKSRLLLVVRALVTVHYQRPRLNRTLETKRNGLEARSMILFHASLLELLRDHEGEMEIPVSRVTERVFMAILRALVDLGLASCASPQSTEQRALRAIADTYSMPAEAG